jgi:hypothetical protein
MRGIDRRLGRLEYRLRATRKLDPVTVCCAALALHEYGPEVAPPPMMDAAEQSLFAAYLDMLIRSATENQFAAPPIALPHQAGTGTSGPPTGENR